MDKFIFVLSLVFVYGVARAAQLVGNEVLLCTNGYSPDNSTCVTYDMGDCGSSDYNDLTPSSTSFISPSGTSCTTSGYKAKILPDTTVTLIYHGAVIGDEITLCNNGYSVNGTSCSTYSRGDCETNYYEIVTNATSFVSPSGTSCTTSGYKAKTLPNTTITLVYHGAVIGDEITLCSNGYSADGTSCTTYAATDCPSNFYNVNVGATSFAENNGSCGSGYHQYEADDICNYSPSGSACVNFCSSGELATGAGTCASLCGLGITKFRTSNGVVVPLWATKQTTPSLNIGYNNGVCYGNLTTEPTDEMSVWIKRDNNKYHTMK